MKAELQGQNSRRKNKKPGRVRKPGKRGTKRKAKKRGGGDIRNLHHGFPRMRDNERERLRETAKEKQLVRKEIETQRNEKREEKGIQQEESKQNGER